MLQSFVANTLAYKTIQMKGQATVANIQSQRKRNRTNEKAHLRNKACKSELKTAVKRVREAVEAKDLKLAQEKCRHACKLLDKAQGRGIIPKNQAANRKSGVQKLVNSLANAK